MATVITDPNGIKLFQMKSQLSALGLEMKGLKSRGGSICAHIKRTYGITARKKADVYRLFKEMIEKKEAESGY